MLRASAIAAIASASALPSVEATIGATSRVNPRVNPSPAYLPDWPTPPPPPPVQAFGLTRALRVDPNNDMLTADRHLPTPRQRGHSPQRHSAAGAAAPTSPDTGNTVPQRGFERGAYFESDEYSIELGLSREGYFERGGYFESDEYSTELLDTLRAFRADPLAALPWPP